MREPNAGALPRRVLQRIPEVTTSSQVIVAVAVGVFPFYRRILSENPSKNGE